MDVVLIKIDLEKEPTIKFSGLFLQQVTCMKGFVPK
jgi:hypothetical protein